MLVTRRAQCLIWQNRNVSGHRVETLPPESTTNADLLRVLADALGLRSSAKPGTNVDWAELLGLAARGGVLSWFSHASEVENSAPEFAIETCKSERMRVAQRNILLAKELCRVSHLLAEREIPCITFKGVAFSVQLHGNLTVRPSGDIDLLVRPGSWAGAQRVLIEAGYRAVAHYQDAFQTTFFSESRGTTVDLHWELPPGYVTFETDSLWRARSVCPILGHPIPSLSTTDALIVACVNLLKDYGRGSLNQVVDVAVTLNGMDSSTWQRVMRRSRQLGCQRFVLGAASVVMELFVDCLDKKIRRDCRRNRGVKRLAAEASAYLVSDSDAETPNVHGRWHELVLEGRFRRRLAKFLFLLVRPNDDDRARVGLPDTVAFLYHLVRPIRWLASKTPIRLRRVLTSRSPTSS